MPLHFGGADVFELPARLTDELEWRARTFVPHIFNQLLRPRFTPALRRSGGLATPIRGSLVQYTPSDLLNRAARCRVRDGTASRRDDPDCSNESRERQTRRRYVKRITRDATD
jgi:hypothetical protein